MSAIRPPSQDELAIAAVVFFMAAAFCAGYLAGMQGASCAL